MSRREFPRAVKVAVIKRAGASGVICCEQCGKPARRWEVDHIRADGLLGEPTLQNAQLLGECCYAPKNAADTTAIAKAKRREAAHLGVRKAPTLHSRGWRAPAAKDRSTTKRANGVPGLARRLASITNPDTSPTVSDSAGSAAACDDPARLSQRSDAK